MLRILGLFALALILVPLHAVHAQVTGYYQSPALHDDVLVFASEGDLWRVAPEGGTALRLTTHPEIEVDPRISPDGNWIAFEATYDGPTEIYVMPVAGGAPTRLTHEGGGVSVRGWIDNSRVLYRTTSLPGPIPRLLRTVDRTSLQVADIPLAEADQAVLMDDRSTLAFTRYGLSMFSDNAIQYRGGRMAQLWRHTLGSEAEAVRLAADFGAPIRHPMAWQGRIYFISDKTGSDNIWSFDTDGGTPIQHTRSATGQMRSPALHKGIIVYQSGADLYRFDPATGATSRIDITLMSDRDQTRQRWLETPLEFLDDARLAPTGESVTVTARGRITTAFTGPRRRIEYRLPDASRARSAALSGDGETLFALVDGGDMGEIWRFPADGRGEGRAVTSGNDAHIWWLEPAPEGDALIFSDKRGRLFYLDTASGRRTLIDQTRSNSDYAFADLSWSPDGRYVAYALYDARDISQIAVFDTQARTRTVLTSGKYESFAPAFSADGAWLYFLSNRNFEASPGAPWGDRIMGTSFNARTRLYALQLDPEARFPFHPADELAPEEDDTDKEDDSGEAESVAIDFEAARTRLFEVLVRSGNFTGLAAGKDRLFLREGGWGFATSTGGSASLKQLEIKAQSPEIKDYTDDVERFAVSVDRETLFVQKGSGARASFLIVKSGAGFPDKPAESTVRLSDWRLPVDPPAEWRQMALDAWRLHRDFAYDPGLRGVDWDSVRERFVPLAGRIGHRSEMDDLLAQMVAELGILHSQVRRGDQPEDSESGAPAFLGATYEAVTGGLRIASVLRGEADRPDTLGPLRKPGVDIRAGDIITAVDGAPVTSLPGIAAALTGKAGQQVRLDIRRAGAVRSAIVVPVGRSGELGLLYADWVEENRARVATAGGGEIGYLHLRAMGPGDMASFARDFYEHFDKPGLVIDVRGNRGGNIDSWIIATLLRQAWAFWPGANDGQGYTNMQQAFRGHLVVLIDEGTYSDGETFAAGIKALDLAPLIGTRTAGAGIWLSDRNRLADGGQARVAEYGQFGIDGRWLIEGRGVSPDIEVDTAPRAAYRGEDAQLDRALAYLRDKIAAEPIAPLRPQDFPPLGATGRDVD